MPTYEYRCDGCRSTFERFQRITDEPLTICPSCGAGVHRLIGATSFILKGGGWYKSDYSSSSKPKEAEGGCSKEKTSPQCASCPANSE